VWISVGRGAGSAAGCAEDRLAKTSDAAIKAGTEAVNCIVGIGKVKLQMLSDLL